MQALVCTIWHLCSFLQEACLTALLRAAHTDLLHSKISLTHLRNGKNTHTHTYTYLLSLCEPAWREQSSHAWAAPALSHWWFSRCLQVRAASFIPAHIHTHTHAHTIAGCCRSGKWQGFLLQCLSGCIQCLPACLLGQVKSLNEALAKSPAWGGGYDTSADQHAHMKEQPMREEQLVNNFRAPWNAVAPHPGCGQTFVRGYRCSCCLNDRKVSFSSLVVNHAKACFTDSINSGESFFLPQLSI